MKLAIILSLALLLASCASNPEHPECNSEYAGTIMHCGKPRPRAPENPEECKAAGGVTIMKDRHYAGCVDHEVLRRILEGR